MSSRQRNSEVEKVVEIISKFASVPDFIVYPEGVTHKLDRKTIEAQSPFVCAMHKAFPNLSWTKSVMERIMLLVAAAMATTGTWPRALTETELPEYSSRMALRIRSLCRHVKQAEAKKSSWILKMLSGEAADVPRAEPEDILEHAPKPINCGSLIYGMKHRADPPDPGNHSKPTNR
jgi:hypothetical protein